MFTRQQIGVGNLLLDVQNYRIVKQDSQKGARDAIIEEQGKKLLVLAKDIIENGLSPFDSLMVVDAEDGNGNYVVVEGNRRLTTINLLIDPELAKGTPIHPGFVKLSKGSEDSIPKVIDCTIAPNRKIALMWSKRKHASGLEGAGTEPWTAMAKARADKEEGLPTPVLDVVDFVLTNPKLDSTLQHHLEGSQFKLSTLERLVTTKEFQGASGIKIDKGRVISTHSKDWTQAVLSDLVGAIAKGEWNNEKFTEREVDNQEKRKAFSEKIVAAYPDKSCTEPWEVSGTPRAVVDPGKPSKSIKLSTPSTEDRANLIPKKFKLSLPPGKINDIFYELKALHATNHRFAVSVLFRVFLELTLDEYVKKHSIALPKNQKTGKSVDKLSVRISYVVEHVKSSSLMTDKELQFINVAIGNNNSLLAPATLNAYVHSRWMNPDPLDLKIAWNNVELFIERLWA